MIPCANPRAQYLAHRQAIEAAVRRVLDGGAYILGEEVAAFEADFAAWLAGGDGALHAAGVASGTDALHVALRALGIGPGDEVVTTSFTAVGTVAAIELAGAIPVLADIDPETFTLDPEAAERALTPRTRALMPVHLYGASADLDGLLDLARRRGLRLIEDCAQAHGATHLGRRVGTFGDIGAFSCYPTKNLGALGDAGVVVTGDAALADRIRRVRQYGWDDRRLSGFPGLNSRLDAVQAAVLRAKLPGLDAANAARRRIAAAYDAVLGTGERVRSPRARGADGHVYHLYTVRTPERNRLQAFLAARGVETRVHYEEPVHRQPAYRGRLAGSDRLPATESASREVLSLPMFPGLSDGDVATVCSALRDFIAGG